MTKKNNNFVGEGGAEEQVDINLDDLFQDDSTKPESNFFVFEKIGDSVQGTLVMEPYEKTSKFGEQTIYTIQRSSDKKEFLVALKATTHKFNILQLKSAQVGDLLAFRLKDLVDVGKGNLCKSLEVRIRHMNKQ